MRNNQHDAEESTEANVLSTEIENKLDSDHSKVAEVSQNIKIRRESLRYC